MAAKAIEERGERMRGAREVAIGATIGTAAKSATMTAIDVTTAIAGMIATDVMIAAATVIGMSVGAIAGGTMTTPVVRGFRRNSSGGCSRARRSHGTGSPLRGVCTKQG